MHLTTDEFLNRCKEEVIDYYKRIYDLYPKVTTVWYSKSLQNHKGLFCATNINDKLYFEVTYNGDEEEMYFDVYDKKLNRVIKIEK